MITDEPTDLFGDSDAGFESGAAPVAVEHSLFEKRTKFFAWHKPRKQFLRDGQWGTSVGHLVDALILQRPAQPLYYLSLPGPDLLDVRSIQPVCAAKNIQLSFIGLNGGADDANDGGSLNAALLNEVRSMPFIDAASDVVQDHFEHLAKKKSIAYERIIASRRTFDVINIDLCSSIAKGEAGVKGPSIVNALYQLLHHQASSRKEDWLIFLTTRSDQDSVSPQIMAALVKWINQLIGGDATVLQSLISDNIISNNEISNGNIDTSKLGPAAHSKTFALGIGNWIIKTLLVGQPAWRVDMLPQFGYHVSLKDSSCDMLSMGFYCKRIPLPPQPDAFGIAAVQDSIPMPNLPDIELRSRRLVQRRVVATEDVDISLHEDPALYQVSLDNMARLLVSARYDEEAYRQFAEVERIKLSQFLVNRKLVS